MNMNALQKIGQMGQMLKMMKNPEKEIMNMLEKSDNPMAKNVLEMAKNGNYQEIENFAKNVCSGKGVDFDKEYSSFKNMLGL